MDLKHIWTAPLSGFIIDSRTWRNIQHVFNITYRNKRVWGTFCKAPTITNTTWLPAGCFASDEKHCKGPQQKDRAVHFLVSGMTQWERKQWWSMLSLERTKGFHYLHTQTHRPESWLHREPWSVNRCRWSQHGKRVTIGARYVLLMNRAGWGHTVMSFYSKTGYIRNVSELILSFCLNISELWPNAI